MALPTVDLNAVWQGLLAIGVFAGGVSYLFLNVRSNRFKMTQEEAAGWERLAKLRNEEIQSIARRLTEMDARLATLRHENEELRLLNLELQRENHELRGEVGRLRNRLEDLERGRRSDLTDG